jgi:hypothetical protein
VVQLICSPMSGSALRDRWQSEGLEDWMPHAYASQFRAMVVEQVRSGRRVVDVAASVDVAEATVYRWVRQDRVECLTGRGAPALRAGLVAGPRRRAFRCCDPHRPKRLPTGRHVNATGRDESVVARISRLRASLDGGVGRGALRSGCSVGALTDFGDFRTIRACYMFHIVVRVCR